MGGFADSRGYESLMGRWSRLLADEFVRFTGFDEDERVLDVGCGTGALAAAVLSASSVVEVVGIDPSPPFVDSARDRLRDSRARFETGDAQRLAFPDGAFDRTMAMLVLNFVPDHGAAATEMRRVTRGGGRVAACVWDYGGEMNMLRSFWDTAVALAPSAAARHERRMPLCRRGELEGLWRDTGLEDVREAGITIEMRFASFADYWQPFLSGVGPSGGYATSLEADMRQALEAKLRRDVWSDCPDEERVLPARAWAVVCTVPGGS